MARILVIADSRPIAQALEKRLRKSIVVETCQIARRFDGGYAALSPEDGIDTVVYVPQLCHTNGMIPNLAEAALVFEDCVQAGLTRLVVISSAAIYGATPYNPGFITESRPLLAAEKNPIGQLWATFEALAEHSVGQATATKLTILRPAAIPVPAGTDYFSRFFRGGWQPTVPLHDPALQLLSPDDLAQAVCLAVERSPGGVFNVAPDGVMPLRLAMRMAGARRLPVPGQQLWHRLLTACGRASASAQRAYIRDSWTVSGEKIARELGFRPEKSTAEALYEMLHEHADATSEASKLPHFDDFGMDIAYIEARRRLIAWFHDHYWRIEVKGAGYIPRQGRAVLVGVHRGFMPFDGVMLRHLVTQEVGRYPRFLVHPCLLKTPFPFDFAKLGCLRVSRENADYVLQHDEILGFFPEGIDGAFRYYRDVYRLGKFGRDEYVKAALRNRAPIVPVVTVGSAEIFPVLAKFKWRWWKEQSLWPYFPIAPPFPLLPLPLPSKWHTQFLEPLPIERQYPPEAANDAATVRVISQEVRARMQDAIDDMLKRRKALFSGNIFQEETA